MVVLHRPVLAVTVLNVSRFFPTAYDSQLLIRTIPAPKFNIRVMLKDHVVTDHAGSLNCAVAK